MPVNAVKSNKFRKQSVTFARDSSQKSKSFSDSFDQRYMTCNNCGFNHPKNKCSVFNRICSHCNRKGHYRKFCRSKSVHEITENGSETEEQCDEEDSVIWTTTETSHNNIEVNRI